MNQEARQLSNRLSSFVFPASKYLDQTGKRKMAVFVPTLAQQVHKNTKLTHCI
jgi:hypothetical protein